MTAARSPELELLLRSARPTLEQADADAVAGLVRDGLDWGRVVTLAQWHRVLPLVSQAVRVAAEVPADVADGLGRFFVSNAGHMLRRAHELVAVVRLLEAHGIPALPYKGPALAAQLYGNLALRHAGDLDVLVGRPDALRARELLFARGYRSTHPVASGAEDFMLRSRYCDTLEHPDGFTVEVHWAFTNGDISFPLGIEALLPNAQPLRLGGEVVRVFGDEDHLLVLAVHGAKHRWARLEWLCGFSQLVKRAAGVDWDRVRARARALRVERRLLLGLRLADEVFGVGVPLLAPARSAAARRVAEVAREVRTELWEAPGRAPGFERAASLPTDWFQLRLSDGARDCARLVAYRATTPSRPESWAGVRIGGRSLPVHALVRPFQAGVRFFPALWSHLRRARPTAVAEVE